MSDRTFTEAEVLQIVGFLSVELPMLHEEPGGVLLEAAEKAMNAVQPTKLDKRGSLEHGGRLHEVKFPERS